MRKSQIVLICAACLFFVTSAVTAQKAKTAMTNADVIQMVGAALSEQVIITSIRQAPAKDFDLTPTGLIALKKAGVSDAIILVMQEVGASAKSTSAGGNKMPADDREQTVNAVLRQAVISQSGGALTLSSVQKINGYEQGVTKMYVLEWQAEIVFQQEGYKMGNGFVGYWQDFRVLRQQPGPLESIGNSPKHFNKGARIRLTGDSTFRKTEQGWRLEGLETKTSQVLADSGPVDPPPIAGSPSATSNDATPIAGLTTISTGAQGLEKLSAAFDRGEDVVFKIKYYSSGKFLTGSPGMRDGLVTVSKTTIGFHPTAGDEGFLISPDMILDVIDEAQKANRVRLKVAIKNTKGNKEYKKDFEFYHPSTFLDGIMIRCTGCDVSMKVLFAFLQHARGKDLP